MSTLEPVRPQKDPKLTRGERCILLHLFTTIVLIVILVIVYVVHVIIVEHRGNDMFKVTRRQGTMMNESILSDYQSLGLIYLKMDPLRAVCNTLLVQKRWSIAPGQCVAARSEPHLSDMLPSWTIKYRTDSYLYTDPSNPGISMEGLATGTVGLISWDLILNPRALHKDKIVRITLKGPMRFDECKLYVSPISELRKHEFCVVVGKGNNNVLVHGAVLYANSNIVGYFSWGQKQSREFPIVILNITSFQDWLDYFTT